MDDLTKRAMAAYFKFSEGADQPSAGGSGCVEHEGKQYVVLQSVRGLLAVYRVRNDGMLKRLKRWPIGLSLSGGARAEQR